MKLFYSPTSPYARKVYVLAQEAGIQGMELVSASGTPVAPDAAVIAKNPLGKIPALICDDGRVLYDSRVICQYLDDLSGKGFYGAGDTRWDILTLEATADGILDAALLMVYEWRVRPEELRFAPWVDGQWAKIDRALDAIESQWLGLLAGPMTMAHIAVGAALGYLDFRHGDRNWRQTRPNLAAWAAAFETRASMQSSIPKA